MAATDEQLALERRRATPAAVGAMIGAILPIAGAAVLQRAGKEPVDKTSKLLFFHDHSSTLLTGAILTALGVACLFFPLTYLFRAVKARRPEFPPVAFVCAILGTVGTAVATLSYQFVLADRSASFAEHGNRTYPEAKHAFFDLASVKFLTFVALAVALALAFALVMISVNAMRVGLLTRFMGILGVIVGVLTIIPLAPGPPVVQSFWLLGLAVLFFGRWPKGVPPAWITGNAEPWPSQQEMREQREAGIDPEPASAPATPAPAPGARGAAASRKRKRKKRR